MKLPFGGRGDRPWPRIVIAGGGTGGHVFPGLAIADALVALANVDVTFAGTARGIESRIIPARGYKLELLDVGPMKGGGVARALSGGLLAARATASASRLAWKLAPCVVVSVGGYASGPMSLAGAMFGAKLAIVEPNSRAGLANRILAPLAARAFVAWPEAGRAFRPSAVSLRGVPIRPGFTPTPYLPSARRQVLILGGSQGASALNDRLPDAIGRVCKAIGPVRVLHQTGRDREAEVREAYAREGVTEVEVAPFIDDVAREMALSDVVIARAGASSVAEIAAVGRASILIPFPFAADDHQAKNAESLERVGGAIAIRQELADAGRLASELERLLTDAPMRSKMADAARAHGRPNAAREIARELLLLAHISERPSVPRTNGVSHASRQAPSDGKAAG